jgi:hypothetical protein
MSICPGKFGFQSTIFGNFGDFGNSLWPSACISQPQTHPGVERFVANKHQTVIQQPYDSLIEALFPAVSGFVFN